MWVLLRMVRPTHGDVAHGLASTISVSHGRVIAADVVADGRIGNRGFLLGWLTRSDDPTRSAAFDFVIGTDELPRLVGGPRIAGNVVLGRSSFGLLLGAQLKGPRQGHTRRLRSFQVVAIGSFVGLDRRVPVVGILNVARVWTAFQLVIEPFYRPGPLSFQIALRMQHVGCRWAVGEKIDHHFDTLIGSLLIVVLRFLNRVKEPISVIGYPLEGVVDAMLLPRIFDQQHLIQQIHVRAKFVRV